MPTGPAPYQNYQLALPFIQPWDCVRKDDPNSQPYQDPVFLSPGEFDQQRYESIYNDYPNPNDSKLLMASATYPFRSVNFFGGPTQGINGGPGHSSLETVFGSFKTDYWKLCPWGCVSDFYDNRDFGSAGYGFEYQLGNFNLDLGKIFPDQSGLGNLPGMFDGEGGQTGKNYLVALSYWFVTDSVTGPVYYQRIASAFQVLNPTYKLIRGSGQLVQTPPVDYQIWRVTGRWAFATDDIDYPNATPAAVPPWSNSSDFTMISQGTMKPGDILTVGPYEFNPITGGTVQAPPAPTNQNPDPNNVGVGTYTDWDGWSIGTYAFFPNGIPTN